MGLCGRVSLHASRDPHAGSGAALSVRRFWYDRRPTGHLLFEVDGVAPGVHILPEKRQLATMTKSARMQETLSVDVPLEETLFVKSELEVLK